MLIYDTIKKQIKIRYTEHEFNRIIYKIRRCTGAMHLLQSKLAERLATLTDLFDSIGEYQHELKSDFIALDKALNRAIKRVESMVDKDKIGEALMNDYQLLSDTLDWFLDSETVYTCGEHADRDIEFKARFSPHPATYSVEEYRAYEKGFKQGVFMERGEKTKFHYTDSNTGKQYYVEAQELTD